MYERSRARFRARARRESAASSVIASRRSAPERGSRLSRLPCVRAPCFFHAREIDVFTVAVRVRVVPRVAELGTVLHFFAVALNLRSFGDFAWEDAEVDEHLNRFNVPVTNGKSAAVIAPTPKTKIVPPTLTAPAYSGLNKSPARRRSPSAATDVDAAARVVASSPRTRGTASTNESLVSLSFAPNLHALHFPRARLARPTPSRAIGSIDPPHEGSSSIPHSSFIARTLTERLTAPPRRSILFPIVAIGTIVVAIVVAIARRSIARARAGAPGTMGSMGTLPTSPTRV